MAVLSWDVTSLIHVAGCFLSQETASRSLVSHRASLVYDTLTFTLVKFQQNPAPPGPVTACGFVPAAGGNADCRINYFVVRY